MAQLSAHGVDYLKFLMYSFLPIALDCSNKTEGETYHPLYSKCIENGCGFMEKAITQKHRIYQNRRLKVCNKGLTIDIIFNKVAFFL